MSENETLSRIEEQRTPRRFVLPSLAISYFAIWPPRVLIGLLLLDIGSTFDQPVGVAGRIQMTTYF